MNFEEFKKNKEFFRTGKANLRKSVDLPFTSNAIKREQEKRAVSAAKDVQACQNYIRSTKNSNRFKYSQPYTTKPRYRTRTKTIHDIDANLTQVNKKVNDLNSDSLSGIVKFILFSSAVLGALYLVAKNKKGDAGKFEERLSSLQGSAKIFAARYNLGSTTEGYENYTGDTSLVQPGKGQLSKAGLDFIKNKEGFVPFAYDDAVYPSVPVKPGDKVKGTLTIGYGHTTGVKPGDTITKEAAEKLLLSDIKVRVDYVNSKVKVPVTQQMFDAMVSFIYRTGSAPKMFANLNRGDYQAAVRELSTINDKTRSKEEQTMFLTGMGGGNTLPTSGYVASKGFKSYGETSYYNKGKNMFGGHAITSGFGYRKAPARGASTYHAAIDIAYYEGEPIYSFTDGIVIYTGTMGGYGITIVIYNEGYSFRYSHLQSYGVIKGQKVRQGQLIAKAGHTGIGTGTHLDFGVCEGKGWNKSKAIDPRTFHYWGHNMVAATSKNIQKISSSQNNKSQDKIASVPKSSNTNPSSKNNGATPKYADPKKQKVNSPARKKGF